MSESLIATLMVAGGAYVVASLLIWVLQIVANWKIFTKAGQAGWKSIIPVYSGYISYKIAWKPGMFWVNIIATFVASYASNLYTAEPSSTMLMVLVGAGGLICAVINIMFSVKLARAYGKGTGFAIGLIFLQPLFLLILGLGSSEYRGADL